MAFAATSSRPHARLPYGQSPATDMLASLASRHSCVPPSWLGIVLHPDMYHGDVCTMKKTDKVELICCLQAC